MPTRPSTIVLVLWLLLSASAFAADDTPGVFEAASAARASLQRIKALREQRPGDGVLAYYEAVVQLSLGERAAALAQLRSLLGRRLGIVPVRDVGFDAVWNDADFQVLRQQLAAEEPETAAAPVAFRLKDPRLVPEGIAFDPRPKRFYLGSVARHKIVVSDGHGAVRDFSRPTDGLDAVLGLAVDTRRGQLYAVSTNGFEDSAARQRRNVLLRYNLSAGRVAARYPAPDAVQLNDVAIAPDGTLYVTDSGGHSLFRLRPGETALSRFGAEGGLRGANGVAVAPDGAVYVTLSTGIARVDTASGAAQRLAQPDSVVTGGIDGLYWHDGDLIGVQNSTNPGRVVRIRLADNGKRIAGLMVLQSHHHPQLDEPTTGAIANGRLYLIANSHVGHYQPDGTLKDPAQLRPTAVLAVPLSAQP